ncbi:MAG: hypothetical protein CO032_08290 [Nitrosopumilales archaeon CG_4_9_14_0_2_um_filter_34_16]|nr:MAG: hypothetical protein CO032_08290 [Nitrosopumilales archaeon CG_4_9_14_0_2_um_filter_34_16]
MVSVTRSRTGLTIDDVKQALKSEEKISKILENILELHSKLDKQHLMLTKLVSMISKMYQDGEINKDTFNRLDEFLHDWLDSEFDESKK